MMSNNNPYCLDRFVMAQDTVLNRVRAELMKGQKVIHWMWFVFPQIAGLGQSPMPGKYAISGLEEAKAYLAHDVLGPRLGECTQLVGESGRAVTQIFGWPDDIKFRSSMTWFAKAQGAGVFQEAIDRYCDGEMDPHTLARL